MKIGVGKSLILLSAIIITMSLAACNDDTEMIQKQKDNITAYIHRLYSADNPNTDPEYIPYTIHNGVYRYILGNVIPENVRPPELDVVAKGSVVSMKFAAMTFGTAPVVPPYYSNMSEAELKDAGLSANNFIPPWDVSPLMLKVGEGVVLMSRMEDALIGCELGDAFFLFLPSDIAYGAKDNGMVAPNSTIAFYFIITNIENVQ